MAKITRYTKDTVGFWALMVSWFILSLWFVVAGLNAAYPPFSTQAVEAQAETVAGNAAPFWYYLGVVIVSMMWSVALYERKPSRYKSKKFAVLVYTSLGTLLGFIFWVLIFAVRYPSKVSEFLLNL